MIPEPHPHVIVFVDGASSGNPGPSGWGAIIATPTGKVIELGGHEPQSTNNRMELMSAIQSVRKINELSETKYPLIIHSDSTYVIQGITQWIYNWKKRGWLTSDGKNVANSDLWQTLFDLTRNHSITWKHVRGHSGVPGNERADEIAVAYSRLQIPLLYDGPLSTYSVSLMPGLAKNLVL